MTQFKTEVQNLTYNAATQCFEALVVLHSFSGQVTYATSAFGPMDTDFKTIAKTMTDQALARHGVRNPGLRSRISAVGSTNVRQQNAQIKSLFHRLLHVLPNQKAA
ncbi:orotidine 5-phosphate decarboxylase [Algirhabdus cladophorae]|uniref:orotidine 5-phosphate decarboxylase n=1 Tax=Algirhabdus cladophorae TaxID=3377108 RepID=UPI003B846C89